MSADQDREALNFFISQRKFKRLVEASGIYALDSGKVVLKKGGGGGGDSATPSQSTKTNNGSTTPATPGTGKKRGRPPGSGKASAQKGRGKKAKDLNEDQDEGVDAEVHDLHQTPSKKMRAELETGGIEDEDENSEAKRDREAEAEAEEETD